MLFTGFAVKNIALARLALLGAIQITLLSGYSLGAIQTELIEQQDFNKIDTYFLKKVYTPKPFKSPNRYLELQRILQKSSGPIAIKGGAFSMGGQSLVNGGIRIDMKEFNQLIKLNVKSKLVTVQGGMRWFMLQQIIDKYNLSVKIMQSYNDFSIGGALSVNCHGRYLGYGPFCVHGPKL